MFEGFAATTRAMAMSDEEAWLYCTEYPEPMEKSLCSEMNLLEVGLTLRVSPDCEKLPVPPTMVPPMASDLSVGKEPAGITTA